MADVKLPPIPFKTPITGPDGLLNQPWLKWFLQAMNRMGGNSAPSNDTLLLSPMTTLGDTIYGGASGAATRLAGNTSATKKFWTQTGTGSVSAAPGWNTLVAGDVPTLNQNTSGTAANLSGTPALPNGTTATTQSASNNSTKLATTAYVDSAVSGGATVPAGVLAPYGGSSAPTGWLLCDGSAVSRTTYAALFAAISTTFGTGDGSTTFNVPDMRGVFPKGAGTTNRTAGKDASGNFYAGTLGTYSTDKLQGHIQGISDPGHSHAVPLDSVSGVSSAAADAGTGPSPSYNIISHEVTGITTTGPASDGTNGTPRTGHTTEPQSLGVTYIVKT